MKTRAEWLAKLLTTPDGELSSASQFEVTKEKIEDENEQLPELNFTLCKKRHDKTTLTIKLTSLVLADDKIWYFEAAASSSVAAHALMAILSDNEHARYSITWEKEDMDHRQVSPPVDARLCDCVLKTNFGRIHHVAGLDRSGKLIVFKTGKQLWGKVREMMSTPTIDDWGSELLPDILKSGMLLKATSFGLEPDTLTYIVAPDAEAVFDDVVKRFVKKVGLKKWRKAHAVG